MSSAPPIKAVIFDCFGVLTTDGWLAFRDAHFEAGTNEFEEARALNVRADKGLIGYGEFIQGIAQLADLSADETRREIEENVANQRLFTFIQDKIRPRYKIGMLSNAGANWLGELFRDWQVGLFDEIALSYQIGTAKPDSQAYIQIASQLGVLPEECVFVDDQSQYVEAARTQGMTGVVFTDTTECMYELRRILTL